MNPEEILGKLEEAVEKVQSNVQSFEKSCNDIGQQVAVLSGVFQEKTNDVVSDAQSSESDVDKLSQDTGVQVIEGAESANDDVSAGLGAVEEQLEELLGTQLDALTENYESTHDVISDFIDQTTNQAKEIADRFSEIGESFTESLKNTSEKIHESENQVQEQLNSFIQLLSNELQSLHSDSLGEVSDFLDTTLNSEFVSFFTDRDGEFTDFSEELTNNLGDMGEALSTKFTEFALELVSYTEEKASEEVKEIVNGMIDHVVGELAEITSKSIIKSSVGVSVTSATSPMLPSLVAFNKLFDALEAAIEAWKLFKKGFGL